MYATGELMETAPVFVRIEEYKDIMDILILVKERIGQAHTLLEKITELKQQEDNALAQWAKDLDEITKTIADIDNTLLRPEQP